MNNYFAIDSLRKIVSIMSQWHLSQMVNVSSVGQNRIAVFLSYNPDFVQKVKSIKSLGKIKSPLESLELAVRGVR